MWHWSHFPVVERGVELDALRDGHAVVQLAVDDERGRFEIRGVVHRVFLVVAPGPRDACFLASNSWPLIPAIMGGWKGQI